MFELIRTIAGFFLVMFLPGYAATWAFYPKGDIDFLQRLALSIGLSISLVVLSVYVANLIFNIPINTLTLLVIIFGMTFIFSVIGYWRNSGTE